MLGRVETAYSSCDVRLSVAAVCEKCVLESEFLLLIGPVCPTELHVSLMYSAGTRASMVLSTWMMVMAICAGFLALTTLVPISDPSDISFKVRDFKLYESAPRNPARRWSRYFFRFTAYLFSLGSSARRFPTTSRIAMWLTSNSICTWVGFVALLCSNLELPPISSSLLLLLL